MINILEGLFFSHYLLKLLIIPIDTIARIIAYNSKPKYKYYVYIYLHSNFLKYIYKFINWLELKFILLERTYNKYFLLNSPDLKKLRKSSWVENLEKKIKPEDPSLKLNESIEPEW
jgi:hypothetical protein